MWRKEYQPHEHPRDTAPTSIAFRTSFSDISAHYHVEVPVAEIAYAYDYINSRHAPRRQATLNDGSAARQDE